MKIANVPQLYSSASDEWFTPREVWQCVETIAPIGLDPCGHENAPLPAREVYLLPKQDGLELPWEGKGLVFVNPPYGREIVPWIKKCANQSADTEVILLGPSRTSNIWFHDYIFKAPACMFWRGRIEFVCADQGAPFPSFMAYWGPRPELFCETFEDKGHCTRNYSARQLKLLESA